jgi:hypothetical protein
MPAMPGEPPAPPAPPAPPPPPPSFNGEHHGTIVINQDHGRYTHHWTTTDGTSVTVVNNDSKEPTAADREKLEKSIATASLEAGKVRVMVDSPAFKAKLARIKAEEVQLRARLAALQAQEEPRIRIELEKAQKAVGQADADMIRARIEAAKVLDDPKVKRQIEEAIRVTSSPEFQNAQREVIKAAKTIREDAEGAAKQ